MGNMIWLVFIMNIIMWVTVSFEMIVMNWNVSTVILVSLMAIASVISVVAVQIVSWGFKLMLVIVVIISEDLSNANWGRA